MSNAVFCELSDAGCADESNSDRRWVGDLNLTFPESWRLCQGEPVGPDFPEIVVEMSELGPVEDMPWCGDAVSVPGSVRGSSRLAPGNQAVFQMKQFTFVHFAYSGRTTLEIRRLFQAAGFEADEYDAVDFLKNADTRRPSDDPRLKQLLRNLHEAGIEASFREEIEYEPEDLYGAELLLMRVARNPRGTAGPEYGTEYDLSTGCSACKTGARQISPLRLGPKEIPKKPGIWPISRGGIILDEGLAHELQIVIKSACGLRQCEDRQTHRKLPWWQILPDLAMPPLDSTSRGVETEEQCPVCKREGFFNDPDVPERYVYRMNKKQRAKLQDFIATWEHFGHTLLDPKETSYPGFAEPGILVSNRVMRVFLDKKVKAVNFIPVQFID